jgi:hypothetical protein
MEEFSKNFNWVKSWSDKHLKYILNTTAPFVAALILIIFYMKIKYKKLITYENNAFLNKLCLALIITKSVIKIFKQDTQTVWPNIYTLDVKNQIYEKSTINHGNNFYYYLADKGDQLCMYSKSPCTSYAIAKNIKHIQKYTYTALVLN